MAEAPVLDWRCTQCGEAMTWQLVKPQPGQEQKPLVDATREAPTLDWSCARCGTATTWMLVKRG
jgi:predicted nucleic acid-binding Zn ribbon protein